MSPKPTSPGHQRNLRRLALAAALVAVAGLSLGLDAGMAVAFSLVVMEVDAHTS
jgi:hypothetical protein